MTRLIHGLYAITPDEADTALLLRKAEQALRGGASVLQYRNKSANEALRRQQAEALCTLSRRYAVPLIINDDVQLAARVEADGVHLGEADASLAAARALLGRQKIIGVSCYNCLSRAREAARGGADYLAFGAFFPSSVKPGAAAADTALLHRARAELGLPLVAIGGITRQNGAELVAAGADALAVITAVFGAADIEVAARDFEKLFIRKAAS